MVSVYPDSPALRRIINHHTKEALVDIVQEWLSVFPITRVNDDLSDDDNDPDFRMDLDGEEPRPRSTRTMTNSRYQKYVAQQYDAMKEKGQKKRVVDRMLAYEWNNGLDARQVAELDLRYYVQHANLKNWKALKLEYGDDGGQTKYHVDPSKIEKTLSHHLEPYFKHAVLRLFKAEEVDEWPLTGRSPSSLAELLLQKDSQGAHSRYRLNQLDDNPLSGAPKTRKPEDLGQTYSKGMSSTVIQAEDMNRIASRDRFVRIDFGPNPQPSLQKVDLQLNLPYTTEAKDFALGRLTRQPFPVKVHFEGTNVIEGIRNLIPLGIASNPMPSFLTELHSMATSTVTVDVDEENSKRLRVTPG
ncbi:hypothetical protein BGZ83_008596 [Gryganskiella cystojenkinii]|nr:hypothetical protein BGZ83_008596 [Gryganskiella cystojenkinii]